MKLVSLWKRVKNLSREDLIFGSILIAFVYSATRVIEAIVGRVLHFRSEYGNLTHFSGDMEISHLGLESLLSRVISFITIAFPLIIATTVILLILIAISYLHQRKLEERISELKNRNHVKGIWMTQWLLLKRINNLSREELAGLKNRISVSDTKFQSCSSHETLFELNKLNNIDGICRWKGCHSG